jgi:hypothetical protein
MAHPQEYATHRVDANLVRDSRKLSDHDCERQARPTTRDPKTGPDLLMGCFGSVYPNGNQYSKVCQDVNSKRAILPVRENPVSKDTPIER